MESNMDAITRKTALMTPTTTKLSCIQRLLISSILVGFLAGLLNWPRESSPLRRTAVSDAAGSADTASFSDAAMSAGWPLIYYSSAPRSATSGVEFSLQAGLFNLVLFVLVALLLGCGNEVLKRFSDIRRWSRPSMGRTAMGGTAVVALGVVVFPLTFWSPHVETRERVDLWNQYGTVAQTPRLGSAVARYFTDVWGNPNAVQLTAPSPRALDQLGQTTTLESITLIKTELSVSDLRSFAALPALKQLRLVQCPLTAEHCLAIGSLLQLEVLEVLECDGSQRLLDPVVQLVGVRDLHLSGLPWSAGAELSPAWGLRLENLRLGYSAARSDFDLVIADRPKLKQLLVYQSGELTADAALRIGLARMPNLLSVTLPGNLPISLSGEHLTRLQGIDPPGRDRDRSIPAKTPLRFRSLSLHSAPSLRDIDCDGDWLQTIALSEIPSLHRLTLSPVAGPVRPPGMGRRSHRRATATRMSELIRQLANCDGPSGLDLSGLPLFGIDISPLASNGRIQTLSLARTGVQGRQIRTLAGLTRLKSLDIWYCDIRDGDIETILATFPRLQSLNVHSDELTRLELVDHPHLQQLLGVSWRQLKSLKITGCPELSGALSLGRTLEKIEIRDAASLECLTLAGPLPADGVLDGFRDLYVLRLEGSAVTDEIFAGFAECSDLAELTLAYPAVTSKSLQQLTGYTSLRKLMLPGAAINDSMTDGWFAQILDCLQEVDLSHTQIGGATLGALVACKNLQRLNIGHTQIRAADLGPLRMMTQLFELELAGNEITAEILESCLAVNKIDRLDLSDCQLSDELKQWLFVSPTRLHFLGLERCDLNDEDVMRLLDKSSKLAIAIDGNNVSEPVIRSLTDSGRLIAVNDRVGFQKRLDFLVRNPQESSDRPARMPPYNRVSRMGANHQLPN